MLELTELTSSGAGGVAVLELRGEGARGALAKVWSPAGGAPVGALRLARLELEGEALDEALVWIESDERVELHVHGSPPLVRRLMQLFDARPAAARSLEDRAAALWRRAASEAGARTLLDQHRGALRRELERVLTLSDDDAAGALRALSRAGEYARRALRATRVAIAGPVNAGKSTLFNLLVGERRAIVSPHPGATRDVLCARGSAGEWPVEWIDTAGEREVDAREGAGAELESRGQALAREELRSVEWVIRLWPADARVATPPSGPSPDEAWFASRSDLAAGTPPWCAAALSAARDEAGAVAAITAAFLRRFALPERAWAPGAAAPFDDESAACVKLALERLQCRHAGWRDPLIVALAD